MTVNQIYEIMNDVTGEVLGETGLVQEDLSNVVDVGTSIFNASAIDNYVRSLVNHVGRVVFVNRPYAGGAPSVLMDGWEYGSVLEKIAADIPEATENESWDLTDGASYDPNVFYKPTVSAKFFNSRVTFEVPLSITERQVKESFSNAGQLNGFISMLYNAIDKSMTIKLDGLIMRTINNMTASTLYSEGAGTYTGRSGVKAVNLLYLYNQANDTSLTLSEAILTPDFIRFAAYTMGVYASRLSKISTLFNIGGKERFTPADMLHFVTLADFSKAADVYLQSDTYHEWYTQLPKSETVPFWQGSGTDYSLENTSKITVTTADGNSVECGGILGVMFDRDALGVTNMDRRVTTNYNPKAEFFNSWFKLDAGYFNDTNENFVVFYGA